MVNGYVQCFCVFREIGHHFNVVSRKISEQLLANTFVFHVIFDVLCRSPSMYCTLEFSLK